MGAADQDLAWEESVGRSTRGRNSSGARHRSADPSTIGRCPVAASLQNTWRQVVVAGIHLHL